MRLDRPARRDRPAYSRNFSVSVVLPASGWLMIANVRRRAASVAPAGHGMPTYRHGRMMASAIDRERLGELMRRRGASRFVELHPRSAAMAAGSAHLVAGVPMPWMTRWPGDSRSMSPRLPAHVRRRRRHRVRRPLPRRHRRDVGPWRRALADAITGRRRSVRRRCCRS